MAPYQPELFRRLLLKLSGEFLAGGKGFGYEHSILEQLASDIFEIHKLRYEIGIVLGGGNIVRGKELNCIPQVAADNVGMLATVQNAIVLSEILKQKNVQSMIFSAFPISKMSTYYTYESADAALAKGKICFLAGGTGNPFFTTDTAAVLRAIELKCDIVLKGTKVDGIYSADPFVDPDAKFIRDLTYTDALAQKLNVMDMTAFSLARDYRMPIIVFDITKYGNLKKAVVSRDVGTLVTE
jgi:uridylate kinase